MRIIVCYFLFSTFFLHTMHLKNTHVGKIDRLMLLQLVENEGEEIVKQAIQRHSFELWIAGTDMHEHPFIIHHMCNKNDNETLSQIVFKRIEEIKQTKTSFISQNISNRGYLKKKTNLTSLDECSAFENRNETTTEITSFFFNKIALLEILG